MLDGDDFFIDNQYISKAIDIIEKNPSVILVGAGIKVLQDATNAAKSRPLIKENQIFNGFEILKKRMALPNHQTDLYPRLLAQSLDFYRDPSMASDSESLFRLCMNGDVAYLSDIVAVWRIHSNNTTFKLNAAKQIKELVFIDKIYNYSLKFIDRDSAKQWRRYMFNMMANHILSLPGVSRVNKLQLIWKVKNILPIRKHLSLFKNLFIG